MTLESLLAALYAWRETEWSVAAAEADRYPPRDGGRAQYEKVDRLRILSQRKKDNLLAAVDAYRAEHDARREGKEEPKP